MLSINKIVIAGFLGQDPEPRSFQSGDKIVTLNVATTERWKKQNGERGEKTEWHTVILHNDGDQKFAEQYLRKGSSVYIEGKLETRKWTDNNGTERRTTEISVRRGGVLQSADRNEQGGGDDRRDNRRSDDRGNGGGRSNDRGYGGGNGDYDSGYDNRGNGGGQGDGQRGGYDDRSADDGYGQGGGQGGGYGGGSNQGNRGNGNGNGRSNGRGNGGGSYRNGQSYGQSGRGYQN